MSGILRRVLVTALVLTPGPLGAQDGARFAADDPGTPAESGEGGHALTGLLIGAGAGIAVGFGLAAVTDYPLKEGGGFGVILAGGGLGGLVGRKIGSAAGRPWEEPGMFALSVGCGWTTTPGTGAIESAFETSGFPAANEHHSTVPSISVSRGFAGPFNAGLELAGIPGQWFRSRDAGTYLSQNVGGQSYGIIVSYAPLPSEQRRLTHSVGAGLDYYSVIVESYFDPAGESDFPEEQPFRASRSTHSMFGLQLRGGLEYWLVSDVSVQVSLVGRWVRPIEVEGVALQHPQPEESRALVPHRVDLSSVRLSVGVGMRF